MPLHKFEALAMLSCLRNMVAGAHLRAKSLAGVSPHLQRCPDARVSASIPPMILWNCLELTILYYDYEEKQVLIKREKDHVGHLPNMSNTSVLGHPK